MVRCLPIAIILLAALGVAAQDPDLPSANPGRPTIATPATLTPVGYLQFETGFLGAWHSPEFSSQPSINEVMKFSVHPRIEFLLVDEPFAHSRVEGRSESGTGGVSLGIQGVLHSGEGAQPTIALSYLRSVYGGDTPDIDIGSARNSTLLLISADIKGFHYDANFFFNEVVEAPIHHLQTGQTLSVSHPLTRKFGLSGEIWHFTQPFLHGNTVGNLWALNYNVRKNLIFDVGFNRGFTSTSTRWDVFAGFTYVIPHKLLPR
jgi:hypothetical protein